MIQIYCEPHKQKALDDAVGLTSLEIAKSLAAPHKRVRIRIGKMMERIPEMKSATVSAQYSNHSGKKRSESVYVLPVQWAKLVVAKYDNERGVGYLQMLIAMEMELMPRLMLEIEHLTNQLNDAKQRLVDAQPRKQIKGQKMALISIYQTDMYGNPTLSHKVWMPEAEANKWKVLEGKVQNARAAARGLLNKAHELEKKMNNGDVHRD